MLQPIVNFGPLRSSGYQGPGDKVSGAFVWYGLRAYSAATRGNKAINVCLTGGASCTDTVINATTGALTITTVGGSSCASVTCYIEKIYDQTGGTNCSSASCDLTAIANGTADYPILTLSCLGSLPCITFGGNSGLETAIGHNVTATAQPLTTSIVMSPNGTSTPFGMFGPNGTFSWQISFVGSSAPIAFVLIMARSAILLVSQTHGTLYRLMAVAHRLLTT
jgi:hypothetical protein